MTDEQDVSPEQQAQEPTQPQTPPAEGAAAPPAAGKEAEEGKAFAILSYALNFVGLPFFLVPLIMRNNAFSLYHAKQCLILWLLGVASGVASGILIATVVLACVVPIIWLAVGIFCLVLNIIGLMNATKLETKPLPLIGQWAEEWFKGIRKAAV